ncbi:hypothetical protein TRAPUB_2634 [Trametes pubescens]|uniref:Uncharacterized protein n=1 Tax=Trametes pubescens TaxID=154538 RepID=A0A1M2VG87_TRAPU|nr:hypothetical protein TRAPUB_2634 [Trametes pubescens]
MYDSESLSDSVSEVSSYDPNVWCSPNAGAYAVVRINAIEMVRHLHDAAALDAAKLMQTKSYLVCLDRTDSPQNIHPSARRSQRSSFDAASGRSSRLSACYRSFECSSSGSDEDLTDTYEGVTDANDDLALTPLFDLWLDLIDNLKEEDIPSPLELQQEIEAIQG